MPLPDGVTSNAMTILILSVVAGFYHRLSGPLLGGMKNVRLKDYTEAYNSGFAWVLILLGLMLPSGGQCLTGWRFWCRLWQINLAILNAIGS